MREIADRFKKAVVSEKSGNLFTPAGRIMYGALFKPVLPGQDEKDDSKRQYQVTLLFPAGFDLSAIEAEVDKLIDKEHKPANEALRKKIKTPIIETAGVQSMASLAEEYPYFVRLSSRAFDKNGRANAAPDVVSPSGAKVDEGDDSSECYNGRWARASVRAYPWTHPTGGKGVSLGLVNVQLLYHDDPLAGGKVKGTSEFETVEDDLLDESQFA
jgi:hypothetical protein